MPWGGSALVNDAIQIPQGRSEQEMTKEIPATYVPARNTIFLALAASCAEALKADFILIGANAVDYSGYPDCRPEYFKSFSETLRLGTKAGVTGKKIEILAPLVSMSKKEIIQLGTSLGVPYEQTWSCYFGQKEPCLQCDSCLLRARGFQEAGVKDPLIHYEASRNR
jgi:7-cyano-7-deazaguanine synthase